MKTTTRLFLLFLLTSQSIIWSSNQPNVVAKWKNFTQQATEKLNLIDSHLHRLEQTTTQLAKLRPSLLRQGLKGLLIVGAYEVAKITIDSNGPQDITKMTWTDFQAAGQRNWNNLLHTCYNSNNSLKKIVYNYLESLKKSEIKPAADIPNNSASSTPEEK